MRRRELRCMLVVSSQAVFIRRIPVSDPRPVCCSHWRNLIEAPGICRTPVADGARSGLAPGEESPPFLAFLRMREAAGDEPTATSPAALRARCREAGIPTASCPHDELRFDPQC